MSRGEAVKVTGCGLSPGSRTGLAQPGKGGAGETEAAGSSSQALRARTPGECLTGQGRDGRRPCLPGLAAGGSRDGRNGCEESGRRLGEQELGSRNWGAEHGGSRNWGSRTWGEQDMGEQNMGGAETGGSSRSSGAAAAPAMGSGRCLGLAQPHGRGGRRRSPGHEGRGGGAALHSQHSCCSCKGCCWHLSSSPAAFKNTELTWWPRALRFCNHTQSWSLSRAAVSQGSPHRLSLLGNQRFRGKKKAGIKGDLKNTPNNQAPLPVHNPSVQGPAGLNPALGWDLGAEGVCSVPGTAWRSHLHPQPAHTAAALCKRQREGRVPSSQAGSPSMIHGAQQCGRLSPFPTRAKSR